MRWTDPDYFPPIAWPRSVAGEIPDRRSIERIEVAKTPSNETTSMQVSTGETRAPASPALRVISRSTAPLPLPAAGGRASLLAALEAMGHCLGVYTVGGMQLRQTGPLERLIDQSAHRDSLLRLIQAAVAEVVTASRQMLGSDCLPAISLGDDHYLVEAAVYQPGDELYVLVNLTRRETSSHQMTDAELRDHYRLTNAEIRVARLLAQMKPNKVIAASLQVSEHTSRHHTEHVLRKLGVRSRNEVARKLGQPG
jgi:DNA-binding CsgD family transcriptional regulator